MEEIIKITVSPAFEGTTTIRLERKSTLEGPSKYYITHDQSQYTGYRAGPDIRNDEIPSDVAEAIIKELESTQVGICPESAMGVDGGTTQIEIERGFNKVMFTWWLGLPKQWKNLERVISLLNEAPNQSATRRNMPDINFECPECKEGLTVDSKGAGRVVPCSKCSRKIQIPTAKADGYGKTSFLWSNKPDESEGE